MCHAWHVDLVTEVAYADIHGGTGLVGLGVVDEKHFELVLEADHAIFALVKQRLLEAVRNQSHRGTGAVRRARRLCGCHCVV
jgi:hypothetical protein